MSDIVNRLIALAGSEHDDLSIGEEAAAEIQRLRAERDEARAVCAGMHTTLTRIMAFAQTEVGIRQRQCITDYCAIGFSPTIGADVRAVVEAARGIIESPVGGSDWFSALRTALAKLGEER